MTERPRHNAGLTQIEALAAILVVIVTLASLWVVLRAEERRAQQANASGTQLRAMMQALTSWAQDNRGSFPLPSDLDRQDATVADVGRTKDTTSNIYSLLIFAQSVTPELLFEAPRDAPWFEAKRDYHFSQPRAAVNPEHALWDPSFNADFSNGKKANSGVAHLQPAGGRFDRWKTASGRDASAPMLSERGEEIVGSNKLCPPSPLYKDPRARMLLPVGTWSGNVAFGDGHVDFVSMPWASPHRIDFTFWDEPGDATIANDFLGIFRTAGDTPAQYQAIWD